MNERYENGVGLVAREKEKEEERIKNGCKKGVEEMGKRVKERERGSHQTHIKREIDPFSAVVKKMGISNYQLETICCVFVWQNELVESEQSPSITPKESDVYIYNSI